MGFRLFPAAVVVAILLAAALFRLQGLSDISQGFYQDEAISGIQAFDLIAGTDRAAPFAPKMMFPLWTALEVPSVAFFGMTPGAVRLPAAILGMVTVVLAYFAGRSIGGIYGALGGAGFLAFSLWHIMYSRIGASPVLVPVEGLCLAIILFGSVPRRPLVAGLFAGLVAGCGLLSYFAGWTLPLVLVAGILLRRMQDMDFRAVARRFSMGAGCGLMVCAVILAVFPGAVRIGVPLVQYSLTGFARGVGEYFIALFINPWPANINPEFWGVYPPGTPFLSPIESLLVIGGTIALFFRTGPHWRWSLVMLWIFLGIMPAALDPEGLRYSRAIGLLAPLALLVSVGMAQIGRKLPRMAPALVSCLLLGMCVWGWRGYFSGYRRDPRVATWSNIVDLELAQYLVSRAQSSRLIILNPASSSSVLEFFAYRETRSGRMVFRPGASPSGIYETVIREPIWNQPMIFVFRVPQREAPGETAILLVNPDGFLGRATAAEGKGRWKEAIRAYQEAIAMFPEFGVAHWRLAGALEKVGLMRESAGERALAVSLGVVRAGQKAGR